MGKMFWSFLEDSSMPETKSLCGSHRSKQKSFTAVA
ncbi:hypothetical protein T4A_10930 [Trichinella pseudospiralis]|uniref:Uncharacterized protein n=1 Tax=Trichinella pseudospiralis TaxID=6337 RepID=A0A0V1DK37_TRIPS|nr:hypothetical protein T4A_10930 [Trichinella pseudospiralis]